MFDKNIKRKKHLYKKLDDILYSKIIQLVGIISNSTDIMLMSLSELDNAFANSFDFLKNDRHDRGYDDDGGYANTNNEINEIHDLTNNKDDIYHHFKDLYLINLQDLKMEFDNVFIMSVANNEYSHRNDDDDYNHYHRYADNDNDNDGYHDRNDRYADNDDGDNDGYNDHNDRYGDNDNNDNDNNNNAYYNILASCYSDAVYCHENGIDDIPEIGVHDHRLINRTYPAEYSVRRFTNISLTINNTIKLIDIDCQHSCDKRAMKNIINESLSHSDYGAVLLLWYYPHVNIGVLHQACLKIFKDTEYLFDQSFFDWLFEHFNFDAGVLVNMFKKLESKYHNPKTKLYMRVETRNIIYWLEDKLKTINGHNFCI